MASVKDLEDKISSGEIVSATRLDQIIFIGDYLFQRLNARNVRTVSDLIQKCSPFTYVQIRDFLTEVCENRRANECAVLKNRLRRNVLDQRGEGGVGEDPPASIKYHVRDVNKAGFITLRNLLQAAKKKWPAMQHASRLPSVHVDRNRASALCGCFFSENDCEYFRECKWEHQNEKTLCVPRNTRSHGFEGIKGAPGQRITDSNHAKILPRQKFIRGWRVPEPE